MRPQLIVTFILVTGFFSCTAPKYLIKSDTAISTADPDKNPLVYIPVADSLLGSSTILDSACMLLEHKKYGKMYNYLEQVKSETPDYHLAKTFYHLSKKEYQEAASELNRIDDQHYKLLTDLLSVDLDYEITKLSGGKDYKRFLQEYQTLIDNYPGNEQLRKIVAVRVRYIRYNY